MEIANERKVYKLINETPEIYIPFLQYITKSTKNIDSMLRLLLNEKQETDIKIYNNSYYNCKYDGCHSNKGETYTLQLRSADEGANTIFLCAECKRQTIF